MNDRPPDLLAHLANARRIVADDRYIWCRAADTFDSRLVQGRGLLLGGAVSPHFLRDTTDTSWDIPWGVRLRHCRVLVCDQATQQPVAAWLPLMEAIVAAGESLLIVTETIESELLSTFVVNALKGTLRVCVVHSPQDRHGTPTSGAESLSLPVDTPPASPAQLPRIDEIWIRRTATACFPNPGDPVPPAPVLQPFAVIETGGENHEDQYDRLRFLMRELQPPM